MEAKKSNLPDFLTELAEQKFPSEGIMVEEIPGAEKDALKYCVKARITGDGKAYAYDFEDLSGREKALWTLVFGHPLGLQPDPSLDEQPSYPFLVMSQGLTDAQGIMRQFSSNRIEDPQIENRLLQVLQSVLSGLKTSQQKVAPDIIEHTTAVAQAVGEVC